MTFSEIPLPQGVPWRLTARKIPGRRYLRQISPSIDCLLNPSWHRNGTDMTAFANQIYDSPVSLPNLQILNGKSRQFCPTQSAA
jgi:hypothetical protein